MMIKISKHTYHSEDILKMLLMFYNNCVLECLQIHIAEMSPILVMTNNEIDDNVKCLQLYAA